MSPFALIELHSKKSDTSTSQFLGTFTEPAYISFHRLSRRKIMYRYKQILYISTLSLINKSNSQIAVTQFSIVDVRAYLKI
jgi:hypothetical protein